MIYYNKDVEHPDFEDVFKFHKIKHEILAEGSYLIEALIDIKNTKHGILDYMFEVFEKFIPAEKEELKNIQTAFAKNLGWIRKPKNMDMKREDYKKWWKSANDEKNKGLYVGFSNRKWLTPQTMAIQKYLEAKKHTELLIENSDKLIDFFEGLTNRKSIGLFLNAVSTYKHLSKNLNRATPMAEYATLK